MRHRVFCNINKQVFKATASPPSRFIKDIDPAYLILPDGEANSHMRERSSFSSGFLSRSYRSDEDSRPVSHTEPSARISVSSASSRPEAYARQKWVRIESSANPPASSAAPLASDPEGLIVGARIRRDRFGEGTVTEMSGEGDNRKIGVSFEHVGQKHLLLKFAKFTILK